MTNYMHANTLSRYDVAVMSYTGKLRVSKVDIQPPLPTDPTAT
jgi:hypothetical protein